MAAAKNDSCRTDATSVVPVHIGTHLIEKLTQQRFEMCCTDCWLPDNQMKHFCVWMQSALHLIKRE